jgi:hypothetical protein
MKPDMLPLCEINTAVQKKLVQADKEAKMMMMQQSQQNVTCQVNSAINLDRRSIVALQGCQIFLYLKYQKLGNIYQTATKLP